MAESDDPAVAASRLEQALERIALLAARPVAVAAHPAAPPVDAPARHLAAGIDTARIAVRLDLLIAQVRAALSEAQRD